MASSPEYSKILKKMRMGAIVSFLVPLTLSSAYCIAVTLYLRITNLFGFISMITSVGILIYYVLEIVNALTNCMNAATEADLGKHFEFDIDLSNSFKYPLFNRWEIFYYLDISVSLGLFGSLFADSILTFLISNSVYYGFMVSFFCFTNSKVPISTGVSRIVLLKHYEGLGRLILAIIYTIFWFMLSAKTLAFTQLLSVIVLILSVADAVMILVVLVHRIVFLQAALASQGAEKEGQAHTNSVHNSSKYNTENGQQNIPQHTTDRDYEDGDYDEEFENNNNPSGFKGSNIPQERYDSTNQPQQSRNDPIVTVPNNNDNVLMTTERFDTQDSRPELKSRLDTDPENRPPVMLSSSRRNIDSGFKSVKKADPRYESDYQPR